MIFDCFTFFNELDLLEVRLNELSGVVDRFVLVEASKTFRGEPKPLHFADNRSRFDRYADKIIYVKVDFPDGDLRPRLKTRPCDPNWAREHYQRDQITRGLDGASPEDLVIVSDVDEILSAEKLRAAIASRRPRDLTIFEMPIYTGAINRRVTGAVWEKGPRMIAFSDFPGAQHLRLTKRCASGHFGDSAFGRYYTRYQNFILQGVPNRISVVSDSGWHMTSIGDWDRFRGKLLAYSHSEATLAEDFKSRSAYQRKLDETTTVVNPCELPKYVQDNFDYFSDL